MSEIYLESDKELPAPFIEPLHNGVIHYQDMLDRKGVLVINPYEKMAIGQRIRAVVVGYGELSSYIDVTEVKQYRVSLNPAVFRTDKVIAFYEVMLAHDPIFYSSRATYDVQGYPTT